MPSLSDKLKSLGVKVGASDLPKPKPRKASYSIEQVLAGHVWQSHQGETFVVEEHYPADFHQGQMGIQLTAPRHVIADWAGDERVKNFPASSFAFIDTETTGLSGGAGTYAFLIGVGRFDGEDFHLAQFFMRDPVEEAAQLTALEEFMAPCDALVTFNGKSFDIPLLHTRFITHGWRPPFKDSAHVDLLHLARRLWSERLASRTLGNLEVQILGASRTEEDVPGWMIPSLYFQYLRSGDARPLKSVFYHNAMDVVSMAALFNHMAGILAEPLNGAVEHAVDIVSMARLFESLGDYPSAIRLYLYGLEQNLPKQILLDAIQRLALIYKRAGDYAPAIELWQQAAHHQDLDSHIELAKYYEHRQKDYETALHWTQLAIELTGSANFSAFERRQRLPELEHRRDRLLRKLSANPKHGDDIITAAQD
ncbi:MAG: ribonuclease H-like domain-containing protein [Anaerolineales bacterium]|jgi:uncharacterized protein YprB with RNaseH-like and TPR domain